MTTPVFQTIEEAFFYCREMDASLRERLDTFSAVARVLSPAMQEAVDRLIVRLMATRPGQGRPADRGSNTALHPARREGRSYQSWESVADRTFRDHLPSWPLVPPIAASTPSHSQRCTPKSPPRERR